MYLKNTPMLFLAATFVVGAARGEELHVAVAANFAAPMRSIAASFEKDHAQRLMITIGSTGSLAAQIRNGAPFQLLLGADEATPAALEAAGLAVGGTRFTYAIGRLALWSMQPGLLVDGERILRQADFDLIAIADPALAPYGAAAVQTLHALGLFQRLQPKFVRGLSIAQTYQFVASGNAALGFVALSQVYAEGRIREGSAWIVPGDLHAPIRQDAALLAKGRDNATAKALLRYLRGARARQIIRAFGYET